MYVTAERLRDWGSDWTPKSSLPSLAAALALHLAVAGAVALWPRAVPQADADAVVSVVFMAPPQPAVAAASVAEPVRVQPQPVPPPPMPVSKPAAPIKPRAAVKPSVAKPSTAKPSVTANQDVLAAAPSPGDASPVAPAASEAIPAPVEAAPSRTLAHPVEAPRPHYPRAARQRGWEGVVLLAVIVGGDGNPVSVEIKTGSGIESLDQAALGAVRRWRFAPATEAGRAVVASLEIPVRFSLTEG